MPAAVPDTLALSLPKVVLHDHLGGSLRPQTPLELLDARGLLVWVAEHRVHADDGPH